MSTLGQVGLTRNKGWFGWLISWLTGSPYNHVVVDIGGRTIGAEPGGAKVRPYSHFPEIVWSRFPETHAQSLRIAAWALSEEGTPYAFLEDAVIGVALITRTNTPAWIEKILASQKRLQCAQLADLALRHGGIHLWNDDRPPGAVTPASFAHVFQSYGWL